MFSLFKKMTPSVEKPADHKADGKVKDISVSKSGVPFGREFRSKYFGFGDEVVPLNHGSFGATPLAVLDARVEHLRETMKYPDPFYISTIMEEVPEVRAQVAEVVDADPDSLVLVTNATTAINSVLRSLPLEKGDKIVFSNLIYGSCRNTLLFLRDRFGVELIEVKLIHPMTDEEVVDTYMKEIDSHGPGGVKMAFFDTVSSMPACIIPWEKLCAECRTRGVLSIVDGAHAIGLIPVSLRKARPDFFTSNLHKWFYVPNSVALLYVDRAHHHYVHSLPVSAVYLDDNVTLESEKEKTRLGDTFVYTGTIDYSSVGSVPDAIKFRNEICGGEDAILAYCESLAKQTGELVAREFGTELLIPDLKLSMVNVRVPLKLSPATPQLAQELVEKYKRYIIKEWKTHIPIIYYNGGWWTRWSAQVYVDIEDVKYGIRALKNSLAYLEGTEGTEE